MFLLAVAAFSARAAFSGSDGHEDETYASRVYHGMFHQGIHSGAPKGRVGPPHPSLAETARAAAFSAAYTSGVSSESKAPRGAYGRPVVLVIGDSLVQRGFETNGWVAQLAQKYARSADIVSRGYSGYNTRWMKELMTHEPDLFPQPRTGKTNGVLGEVCLVIILLGANDAVRPEGRKNHYGVSVEEYEKNLKWIIGRYVDVDDASSPRNGVVLCTPPPVDEDERLRLTTEGRGMPADLLDRSFERTAAYAEAARRVGEALNVPVADLHAAFRDPKNGEGWEKRLLSDGLHFTSEGQSVAFRTVFGEIHEKRLPEALGWDAPTHEALLNRNETEDWHGHLMDDHGTAVVVE